MSAAAWVDAWNTSIELQYTDRDEQGPGRTLARRHGDLVEVEPGRARWVLETRSTRLRPTPEDGEDSGRLVTDLSFASIGDQKWQAILERIGGSAVLVSEVLTGGWPNALATALMPDRGETYLTCTCDGWHEPCRHGWGLLTAVGESIASDPQVLLVLRGRSRSELVDALRPSSGPVRPSVPADEAYRRSVEQLPRPLPLPWRAVRSVELGATPPPDSGVGLADLDFLVADAAARATTLLSGEGDSGLYDDDEADLVRRAAEILRPGNLPPRADLWDRLVDAAGLTSNELEAWARAWLVGGRAGLAVHRGDRRSVHEVPATSIEAALDALGGGRRLVDGAQFNGVQIRCAGPNEWWRFVADDRLGWLLVAGPFDDPVEAVEPG